MIFVKEDAMSPSQQSEVMITPYSFSLTSRAVH
jgi:hypothetical protein